MTGETLGHYEIVQLLGKGGMGEVYIANDTRLNRQVALKVLPAELAGDAERRARFEREAQAVASPWRCTTSTRSRPRPGARTARASITSRPGTAS